MRQFLFVFAVLFTQLVFSANAQVTTSSITGVVSSADGELPGATVVAVHVASGTQYAAVTNAMGRYVIQGMRPGGPYKITFQFVGQNPKEENNVYLQLGETSIFNETLSDSNEQIQEVVVVASGRKAGVNNFDSDNIVNTPSVNRSIYDVAKQNPLANISKAGGITFAGSNNRYNSFQIDGTVSNDVFGLAPSGTNGGQTDANPISLEAIQEIQVVVSPFEVTQSGFTGGGINAVTKSGTNKFTGSVYGYYTNENFYSDWSQSAEMEKKLESEKTKTIGANVGGAVVKDKLFYFVSVENTRNEVPNQFYPGAQDFLSSAEAQAIADHYYKATGIREGIGNRGIDKNSLNLLGRIDWNITGRHKMALRYQYNDAYKDKYDTKSTAYYFPNSTYRQSSKTNSVVLELNSNFSQSVYNEFRAGLTYVRDKRDIKYLAPNAQIYSAGGDFDVANNVWNTGNIGVSIGTEASSGANAVDVDAYTFEDNLSLYKGNHSFTFGTHNEVFKSYNLFIQHCTGTYMYNSTQDFLNDNAFRFQYNYSDPALTGSTRWAGTTKTGQFGFYAQDKWNVSRNMNLTYGIRVDIPVAFNSPTGNPEFNDSDYARKYDVKVGDAPSVKLLWSPRLGFRYYLNDSHKTLLRGGLGMFTGRVPFVWLTNLWNNTGMEMKGITITKDVPSLMQFGSDAQAAMNSSSGSASKPTINTADRGFKYPQVLRANLALEHRLPGGVKVTFDALLSKTMNNVFFENLALSENDKVYAVEGVEASAAPYFSSNAGGYYTIINLKNTSKGYSYSLTAKAEKNFDFGLDLMAAYTYGRAKSVNDGTSSVAASNWKYNYSVNPNSEDEVAFSYFDVPNRIVASASYTSPKYCHGLMSSTLAITYTASNGQRYCLTMNESADYNGDTQKGNSLLYIPTDAELQKMSFASEDDRAKFASWIADDKYASNHRGQYAERYSNTAPFEHHWDLHFAQNIFYLKERGSRVQLSFDIINFSNMLCHNWGTYYDSLYNLSVLKCESVDAGSRVATFSYNNPKLAISDLYSRWHAQIGFKIIF